MNKAKSPTEEALRYLKKVVERDSRKKVRQRAQILLLSWIGLFPLEIVQQLGCDKNTVYKWIEIWNKKGIGALVTWRQTITWKKQFNRRKAVKKLVTTSPKSLKLAFNVWSLKKLSIFLKDLVDYTISPTTIWRDLKILKINYLKTQDKFKWKPVNYDIRKAELLFLKHFCPLNWRIIYVDEKGPVHALRYSGQIWSMTRPQREIRQPSKGKIMFLGGYDPLEKKLAMIPMETHNSSGFCHALDLIRLEFLTRDYNHLIMIMDNARIHTSKFTRQYFDDDPQIDIFYLPTYSPELNPIEICFKHYSNELLNNSSFNTKEELISDTTTYADYYGTLRKEIYA